MHCEEAERHVLAAYVQGHLPALDIEWFAGIGHPQLVRVLQDGVPATREALLARLVNLSVPGDLARSLSESCFAPVEYDPAVLESVKELAVRRRLATVTADELVRLAQGGASLREGLEEALAPVRALLADGQQSEVEGLSSLVDWTRRRFEGEQYGYRASWPLLEKVLGPLARDRLFVLSGRQKVGKSIWALSLALDVAEQGGKVWFNALDMGRERTFLRLVSVKTGLPFIKLWRNEVSAAERQLFEDAAEELERLPVAVVRVADVREFGRMSAGSDMSVVDYLQMASAGRHPSKTEEVTAVVGELKNQAADHFVLAVSQLSRGGEPLWSGAIEQMADILAELKGQEERRVVLDVQYHRDGPTAQVPYYLFYEVERALEMNELSSLEVAV